MKRYYKWETNSKMVDLNPTIPTITSNINVQTP